jgi:hypothetical protein
MKIERFKLANDELKSIFFAWISGGLSLKYGHKTAGF